MLAKVVFVVIIYLIIVFFFPPKQNIFQHLFVYDSTCAGCFAIFDFWSTKHLHVYILDVSQGWTFHLQRDNTNIRSQL